MGKSAYPFQMAKEMTPEINPIKRIEFARPDLKENSGNFSKWIGLIIKIPNAATSMRAVLGSP